MEKSESIVNLTKALIKAQSKFGQLAKNKRNTHLNYNYADLDSMKNATMPSLKEHGLTLNFFPANIDGVAHLEALLIHESGEYILSRYPVTPEKPGMQGTGAAITYLKKYIWGAVFSLYDDENDDDVGGNGNKPEERPYEYNQAPQKTSGSKAPIAEAPKPVESTGKISTNQALALMKEIGDNKDLLDQILSGNKISGIQDLPSKNFNNVLGFVQQVRVNRK